MIFPHYSYAFVHITVIGCVVSPVSVHGKFPDKMRIIQLIPHIAPNSWVYRFPMVSRHHFRILLSRINHIRMGLIKTRNLPRNKVITVIHPDMISCRFEFFEKTGLVFMKEILHGPVPSYMGIKAGKEGTTRRNTDGILAIRIRKRYCLALGKRIKIRSHRSSINAHVSQCIPSHLIRIEYHYVGLLSHSLLHMHRTCIYTSVLYNLFLSDYLHSLFNGIVS